MTTQEMRELDAWIAENVFGWQEFREEEYPYRMLWREGEEGSPVWDEPDYYTTDPAAAMEVLKKCADNLWLSVGFSKQRKTFLCGGILSGENYAEAETLELAICQFAKKLFTK